MLNGDEMDKEEYRKIVEGIMNVASFDHPFSEDYITVSKPPLGGFTMHEGNKTFGAVEFIEGLEVKTICESGRFRLYVGDTSKWVLDIPIAEAYFYFSKVLFHMCE